MPSWRCSLTVGRPSSKDLFLCFWAFILDFRKLCFFFFLRIFVCIELHLMLRLQLPLPLPLPLLLQASGAAVALQQQVHNFNLKLPKKLASNVVLNFTAVPSGIPLSTMHNYQGSPLVTFSY